MISRQEDRVAQLGFRRHVFAGSIREARALSDGKPLMCTFWRRRPYKRFHPGTIIYASEISRIFQVGKMLCSMVMTEFGHAASKGIFETSHPKTSSKNLGNTWIDTISVTS